MTKRIKAADLPEFDTAQYLDSREVVATYLTDILEANDPALLAAALGPSPLPGCCKPEIDAR